MSYRGQDEKEAVFSFLGWAESPGSLPRGKECLYSTVYMFAYMFVYVLYTTVYVVYYSMCCILQYAVCYSDIHRYNEVIHFP